MRSSKRPRLAPIDGAEVGTQERLTDAEAYDGLRRALQGLRSAVLPETQAHYDFGVLLKWAERRGHWYAS